MEHLAYWIGGAVGIVAFVLIIDQAFGFGFLDPLIKRKQ